jgi:hypothetical protein
MTHRKLCLACVWAKQKLEGATFARAKKPTVSKPMVAALQEIVRVLVRIRTDICQLVALVDD